MPGIIILKQDKRLFQRNEKLIHEMADAIKHESFYKSQYMAIPELGLHACNVYLDHEYKPKDISKNEDGSIQCLLSGELFGISEIIQIIKKGKHSIRDQADVAELIIHLYEEKSTEIFSHLNGHFNLLLVDNKRKLVLVSNDRFGIRRFYYSKLSDDSMMFAPEVKCFKFLPEIELALDETSVIQNFKYNCLINNKSFYQNVHRFPIATSFNYESDNWKKHEYWTPEKILDKPKLDIKTFINESTELFESIVENYYTPGVTGFSLTGGYDTRAVLAVLNKKGINLPCYTFTGMYNDSIDMKLAKKLADLTGNTFHKILLGEDFLKDIDKWFQKAVYISDGIAKLSFCHEYYVNLAAKEYGTVRITGKYGSQVVRGVSMLKDRSPQLEIFSEEFRRKYVNLVNDLVEPGMATLLREELHQLEATKQTQEDAALTVRTPYMDINFVDLMLRAPVMEDKSLLHENIIQKKAPHFLKIPMNHFAHIPTNINRFIKTGPISNSIKLFYLSKAFFDSVYNWENLPSWTLLPFKMSELLRISRIFNGEETWVHYRLWIMKELRKYISDIILDPITLNRPWYDGKFIESMMKRHFSGMKNYTSEIIKIVSFETWCRQNDI